MGTPLQMIFAAVLLLTTTALAGDYSNEDAEHWRNLGTTQLDETLKRHMQDNHAKNVIIFIGDGMGISTITSARIYKGQKNGKGESESLSFEKFPITGISKTYSVNKQVTDSAQSATSMFTGVKTNNYMLGLDATVKHGSCDQTSDANKRVNSIMVWAQNAGKDTGLITKTRVTHATPAALYAHISNRNWECDTAIPTKYKGCVQDIAMQLVKGETGKNFKVIMGGGADQFGFSGADGPRFDSCNRTDKIDLAQEWKSSKKNSALVYKKKQLMDIDIDKTDYLLGLFSPDHMYYAGERENITHDQPSLVNMTTQAIKLLKKNKNGFVLMVEGGLIDIAHHSNFAKLALEETLEFEEAVAAAVSMTNESDTLIITTADHSHTLTINGYPDRGNDILGITKNENEIYETLSYANGPGYTYHRVNDSGGHIWRDLNTTIKEREGIHYQHFSPIHLTSETHGGEDVPVYVRGPSSFVFSGVYESNYIAHAISYAACIGLHSTRCGGSYAENFSEHVTVVPCGEPNDTMCNNVQVTEGSSASLTVSATLMFCLIPLSIYLKA